MTTMIEKVAQAISDSIEAQGATLAEIGDDLTLVDGDLSFSLIARAAIEAMREPTEAIFEAGEKYVRLGRIVEVQWQRMIDAALKEGQ